MINICMLKICDESLDNPSRVYVQIMSCLSDTSLLMEKENAKCIPNK